MKIIYTLLVASVLAAPHVSAQTEDPMEPLGTGDTTLETLDPALLDLNRRFNRAIVDSDLGALLALYADDVFWLPPGEPASRGLNKPNGNYRSIIENDLQLSHTVDHTIVARDRSMAFMIGRYRLMMPNSDLIDEGKYSFLLKPHGASWRIATDMFNSSRSSPETENE